ncbi:MAG: ferritin family protein [Deltaproteobacteria bacterium]|nr:ferritin family protein [Deltaproteobacteria bacterium]
MKEMLRMYMAEKRLEALKQALKMEEDGKAFYERARDKTKSKMGKSVFESLIRSEESHIKKIKELYDTVEKTCAWPPEAPIRDVKSEKNVFEQALAAAQEKVKADTDDLEGLKLAVELERAGKRYYELQADQTDNPCEKKFYYLLAHEEGEHFMTLIETIQYLEDPGAYFHQKEITRGHY